MGFSGLFKGLIQLIPGETRRTQRLMLALESQKCIHEPAVSNIHDTQNVMFET